MSEKSARIRILCVDDHPLVRHGIAGLLATVQHFRARRPDVTLMDLQMPESRCGPRAATGSDRRWGTGLEGG
jgi:DNA-binding NarL/FixJ family response regulator